MHLGVHLGVHLGGHLGVHLGGHLGGHFLPLRRLIPAEGYFFVLAPQLTLFGWQ